MSETTQPWWRRSVWWIVAAGIVTLSAAIVWQAGTRPGYDPYGWLGWGYQSLHGSLNLGGAPSWKPLPLLLTVPFALAGHDALWLWMVSSVAVSLSGSAFAARVAFRIVCDAGRAPAIAAAAFAGLGIYGIQDDINGAHQSYVHYLLSVQSDTMIVSLVLAAIDMHMLRHRRWVLTLLGLAALGRPEAWPALVLYGLWCLSRRSDLRAWVVVEGAAIAFMWFGIPAITNGRPFIAGDLAQRSPRALHGGKVIGTIDRFTALNLWPVWVLALLAVGWALWPGPRARGPVRAPDRLALGLAALIVMWMVVEVAFALHGFPGVPRYMFEPAAVAVLLGGVGLGRLLGELPEALPGRLRAPAIVAGVAICAALIPGARARIANEHRDLRHERLRATQINRLAAIIQRLGGRRAVLGCGRPVTNVEYVSILAWLTGENTGIVGHRPQFELHQAHPVVLFTALPSGWATWAWHTRRSRLAPCRAAMDKVYVATPGHPHGVTVTNRIAPRPDPPIPDTPLPG